VVARQPDHRINRVVVVDMQLLLGNVPGVIAAEVDYGPVAVVPMRANAKVEALVAIQRRPGVDAAQLDPVVAPSAIDDLDRAR